MRHSCTYFIAMQILRRTFRHKTQIYQKHVNKKQCSLSNPTVCPREVWLGISHIIPEIHVIFPHTYAFGDISQNTVMTFHHDCRKNILGRRRDRCYLKASIF